MLPKEISSVVENLKLSSNKLGVGDYDIEFKKYVLLEIDKILNVYVYLFDIHTLKTFNEIVEKYIT